jgi:hypothetical protein
MNRKGFGRKRLLLGRGLGKPAKDLIIAGVPVEITNRARPERECGALPPRRVSFTASTSVKAGRSACPEALNDSNLQVERYVT